MKYIVWSLMALALASCDIQRYPQALDEPTHIFYGEDQFRSLPPGRAVLVGDGNTADPFAFTLRPAGVSLRVPKNHLITVAHQYQPWAKRVYDVAVMVALLPDFDARSEANADQLMNNSTGDQLKIVVGSLAGDGSAAGYRSSVETGVLVLDPQLSSPGVPAYRKAFDLAGNEPFFALPDPMQFRSPLGNAVVIVCQRKQPSHTMSTAPVGNCHVQTALPSSFFPGAEPAAFGKGSGIRLYYHFDEKYLSQWSVLHRKVLDFLTGFATAKP